MKVVNTTVELARYFPSHVDRVRCMHELGYTGIDLSFFYENRPDAVFMQPNWRDEALRLRDYGAEHGIAYLQSHLPSGNPLTDPGLQELNKRCIEVCGILGIPAAVIHAGAWAGMEKKEFFERNAEYVRQLLPVLEANHVTLCQENSASSYRNTSYFFFTGSSLAEFCEYVDHPLVGACWDTGHANMEGPQHDEILALGKHLKAIHLNDNYGVTDDHLLPFMGTMNVDAVMTALKEVDFRGPFTLEADGVLRPAGSRLSKRRPFAADTRLADPPLEVMKAHLRNSYEVARAILKAYDLPED